MAANSGLYLPKKSGRVWKASTKCKKNVKEDD